MKNNIRNISHSQLLLIARRWSQRGQNTDFDHFFNWFPGAKIVTSKDALTTPYRLFKKLGTMTGQDGYTSYSAGIEFAAIKKTLKYRPKLIHFWFADHDYHYAWRMAKLIGARIVGNFFFSIEEFERRIPNKGHLKHLDLITSSGRKQMDYLTQFVSPDKIAYLPLGIDTEFYHPPNKLERWGKPFTLLHVGTNRRDFHTLKKVFIELKSIFPDIHLEFVHGKEAEDIFKDMDSVKFYPFLSDEELVKVYQKATLLLLPLLEGGSSQTLNEAMATGLPVVTNRLPNLEDYISNSCVSMVPVGNVEMMVSECKRLLEHKDQWESATIAVRENSLQFDFKCIRKQLLEIYKEHLGISVVD